MARKKICHAGIISLALLSIAPLHAETTTTELNTQTLQITTRLQKVYGHPTWTLTLRDEDSQQVLPFIFDFARRDNFWVAFTHTRHYRIVQSSLQFGPYGNIYNFCHLENRSFTAESLYITLKGLLSPVASTSACYVHPFKDANFPVVVKVPDQPEEPPTPTQ